MPTVYCAIVDADNSDYWDGTIAWGYDATSDRHNPTPHTSEGNRDTQYAGGVYNTINDWEVARDGVANGGDDEYAIIQGPWDNDDTAVVGITFANVLNLIEMRAIGAARQAGIWDDGADSPYRLVLDPGASGYLLRIFENNVTVDGFQFHNTNVGDNSYSLYVAAAHTGLNFSNLIINSNDAGVGIRLNHAGITADIWNCIFYNPHTLDGDAEGIYLDDVDTANVYNNTVDGFTDGVEVDAVNTAVALKNNIIFGNTTNIDDAVGVTIDYNATDAGDEGTNMQTPSGGDWANEMTNYAANDYELDAAGNCYNNGVTNPGAGLYSDDITGTTRTVSWSIGAWEYDVGAPPAGQPYFKRFGGIPHTTTYRRW